MSVLDEVLDSLTQMSQLQLLLAFVGCTAYGLAQGRLLGPRVRRGCLAAALLGTAAFVGLSARWEHAAMLVAIAVAGMGSVAALVWLTSHFLGIDRLGGIAPAAPAAGRAASTARDTPPPRGANPVTST